MNGRGEREIDMYGGREEILEVRGNARGRDAEAREVLKWFHVREAPDAHILDERAMVVTHLRTVPANVVYSSAHWEGSLE